MGHSAGAIFLGPQKMESLRPDILEQLPGVLNMGFSSTWGFGRIFQHIPGTYPKSPTNKFMKGIPYISKFGDA